MNTTQAQVLAEVLANLAGDDPNNDTLWQKHLADAETQLAAAERGEQEAWWENKANGGYPCPRCGGQIPNNETPGAYPGAMSRHDSETEVCSQCGQDEAMLQWGASSAGKDPATVVHPVYGERPWESLTKTVPVTVSDREGNSRTVPVTLNPDGSMEMRGSIGNYGFGRLN